MKSFRSWSRRAWFLHGYLIAVLALMPAPSVRSVWIDTDSDTVKDSWEDTTNNVTHSMTALDAMNLDVDGDGAYNSEELTYGSDPFDLDSDDDGLNDGDEIHLANEQAQKGYSLLMWDSNGDGVSDHDDFYGVTGVTYPGGVLPSFPNATYSDYDGDGIKNPFDAYPTDPTNNDGDGDGIDDGEDPAPGDASNTSPYNGAAWNGNALGDDDLDGIQNFWDSCPDDPQNGTNDVDNDGIEGALDPFPEDNSNYSYWNGIYWYGNVLGDDDYDGVPNYSDQWPYDGNNGAGDPGGPSDSDGDGIDDYLDPAPGDSTNQSVVNGIQWQGYALEDADNDGQANFYDPYPEDPYDGLPDYDGDGIANEGDPFPKDNTNYSALNGITWAGSVFGDDDMDAILNWMDSYPSDCFNGDPDADADGILNENDPYPWDLNNYSPINGISWGTNALADEDGDSTPNWADDTPYPGTTTDTDADDDGLDDSVDPAPYDPSNLGPTNGMYWYTNALGDDDGDFYLNYWDDFPYDPLNGAGGVPDSDGDGMDDAVDPAPGDFTNYSPYNFTSWYSGALDNADNDGSVNFYDYSPYQDSEADSDGDGYLDINDPAPSDWANLSSANGVFWYNDVFGDADGDWLSNFYDSTPYGEPPPVDNDWDGLTESQESGYGTSDYNPDSDGDGLTDGEEVNIFGTSPTNAHYLSQQRNWGDLYTDWQLAELTDSDGDLIPDRIEQHYQLNPEWAGDARLDRDNNGLSNYAQYEMGIALDADLDRYDSDGDGMSDVFEDYNSPALSKNNPNDAVLDPDNDGVLNYEEMQLVLSPRQFHTGHENVPEPYEMGDLLTLMGSVRYPDTDPPSDDANNNNNPDWAEAAKLNPAAPDYAYFTRQLAGDLDGDGMSDAWEHEYRRRTGQPEGMDLRVATDAAADPDDDGLTNLTEFRFGTHPLVPETQAGTQDRNRFNRHGSTPTNTIPGGGLMSRYRAQLAADLDLDKGSAASRAFQTPLGVHYSNEVRPYLKARMCHNASPGVTSNSTALLPVTLSKRKVVSYHYESCSCSQAPNADPDYNWIDCSCDQGKLSCPDCNETKLAPCKSCHGDGVLATCYACTAGFSGFDENGNPISCLGCGGDGEFECGVCVDGTIDCLTCDLEGKITCEICDGTGKKMVPGDPAQPPAQIDTSSCPVHGVDPPPPPDSVSEVIYTTSADVELVFPPTATAHFGTRYRILVNDEPYAILSVSNRTVSISAPSSVGQTKNVDFELVEEGSGTVMVSDSAGPRYRKIGLNGMPLSDSKPQQQYESGENPEETYIDAYTRQLRHSVSDVYANAEGSLLPLMVRRDVQPEAWSLRSGLRPQERPEAAFGAGWTSNVCAYVRFERLGFPSTASAKAVVSDEMGGRQTFYLLGNGQWVHSREEVLDAKTSGNQFSATANGLVFGSFSGITLKKKFGTTCEYELVTGLRQTFPKDRERGSDEGDFYTYARLRTVTDRHGNKLVYSYPPGDTLIPCRIEDPDRPGRHISITQGDGVITALRGPDGSTVDYTYHPFGSDTGPLTLTDVTRGGNTVHYAYGNAAEEDPTPSDPGRADTTMHLELIKITDELNRAYKFERAGFDHSVKYMTAGGGEHVQTGLPRPVTRVTLPENSNVMFTGGRALRGLAYPPYMNIPTLPWTEVSGPAGTYRYDFSQPVPNLAVFSRANTMGTADENVFSTSVMVNFTKMEISMAGDSQKETYTFNPAVSMALATVTDRSGNMTRFVYDEEDGFDDPTEEIDALGNKKTFTYDPITRVMASMKDALGTVTVYGIENRPADGVFGLKVSEVVTGMDGTTRATYYSYEHPTFKGLVTKQWTKSSDEAVMPSSVVLTTLGQAQDAQGSNPGWWNEVTTTAGTATASGTLATAQTTSTTLSDFAGRKRSVIDPCGLITNFAYDDSGRLSRVTHPDTSHKDMHYDEHGNLTEETNEKGVTVFHEYNEFNQRTKTTVDLNGNGLADSSYTTSSAHPTTGAPVYDGDIVTTTTYNARNQVHTQTDARGKVTTHLYDAIGRLRSTQEAGLPATLMEYGVNSGGSVFDSSGFKPTKITDPVGTVTELTYDKLYRTTAQKVTYRTGGAAYHPLRAAQKQAQQTWAAAASATGQAAGTKAQAQEQVAWRTRRLDPVLAQVALDAADEVVESWQEELDEKSEALGLLQGQLTGLSTLIAGMQQSMIPLQNAVTVAEAATETAVSALENVYDPFTAAETRLAAAETGHAAAVQAAADAAEALTTAQMATADVDEKLADRNAKQMALQEAEYALSSAAGSLLEGETLPGHYQEAVTAAAQALASAQMALNSAQMAYTAEVNAKQAAKQAADAAVGTAASERTTAAAEVESTRPTPELLATLGAAVATAQGVEAAARNALVAPQALLDQKTAELEALEEALEEPIAMAETELFAAVATMGWLQETASAAADDLQAAQEAQNDPEVRADMEAELAAAEADLEAATTVHMAKAAEEAQKLALKNAAEALAQTIPAGLDVAIPPYAQTTTTYDVVGKPLTVTDPLGRVTKNSYDSLGRLTMVTEPDLTPADATDNPTVRTFYTTHGKPWKVIDQMGHITTTTYDALGRPVNVTSPAVGGVSAITTTEYDAAGNAVRVTDALGRETETVYDVRNRPVTVMAPTVWDGVEGEFVRPTTSTTYDALGQVLTVTDPMGHVTTNHYDRAGRKWKVEAPAPEEGAARPTTRTTYDAGGLALTVKNPLNQTITNTYNEVGQLLSTKDAAGIYNHFTYDAVGNRLSVKDGKGQVTTFEYDGLKRLVRQVYANEDEWTHTHNAVQKIAQSSPRGIVTSYTYDARDRLLTVSALAHNGTPALGRSYTYDNAGRLLTVTEAGNTAADVSNTYDAMGRVTAESSRGKTHTYVYDLAGNRTQASYSTGRVVETAYDGLNRPEVISEGGRVTRYGYDLAGRAVVLVSGNGQTSSNTYDALGRLVDRTLFKTAAMSEGEVLAEFSWEHDALGNVKKQYETWPGDLSRAQGIRATTMGYDANNRLTSEMVTQPEVSGATPTTWTAYTYDAANNRVTKTVTRTLAGEEPVSDEDTGHWSYTYNAANQLTAWEKRSAAGELVQKSAAVSYDAAGNRSSQTVTESTAATVPSGTPPAAKPGTTNYAWDAQDRLLGVTLPDGSQHRYEYDYRTRRVGTSSTTGGVTKQTAIVFSGGLSVAEWESSTGSLPVSPTVEYTRGPDMGGGVGGLLYSLRDESGTVTPKYNLSNGRGDIVAQSNQSAALTWTASYEAYGKRTKETGENKDKQRGNSKDEDPTGLLNEGFRYRDLETGVWMSRDPAGFVDGPNVYAYVKQNPWGHFDPLGLMDSIGVTINGTHYGVRTNWFSHEGWTSIFQFGVPASTAGAGGFGVYEPLFGTWDAGLDVGKANLDAVASQPVSYAKGFLTGESDGSRSGDVGARNSDALALLSLGRNGMRMSGGGAGPQPQMVTTNGTVMAAPAAAAPAAAPAVPSSVFFNQGDQSGGSPEASQKDQAGQNQAAVAKSGETTAAKAGRQAHKEWKPGEGFEKEVTLPSGKRADAVNLETKQVKELKPDNPRAVKRGEKQVEGYRQELEKEHGGDWTGTVETYKR